MTKRLLHLAGYVTIVLLTILSLIPFAWMLISATHTTPELFQRPLPLYLGSHFWENFVRIQKNYNFLRTIFNSLLVATVYTVFSTVLSALAGYGLAKFKFRGKGLILGSILITMMIPVQVLLIPLFKMMANFGWIDSYQAVILPFIVSGFGIFLMRQAFLKFPNELIESARIDGAKELRTFYQIVLPVTKPQLVVLIVYTFITQWSAFIWPLLMLNSPDKYTIPLALNNMVGLSRIDYSGLMLGSLLATAPILILFAIFQKQFIAGLLGGAIKG